MNNTSDGDWHDIDVVVTQSLVILTVDGSEVSEAAGSSSDFADIQTVSAVIIAEKYEGIYLDITKLGSPHCVLARIKSLVLVLSKVGVVFSFSVKKERKDNS